MNLVAAEVTRRKCLVASEIHHITSVATSERFMGRDQG